MQKRWGATCLEAMTCTAIFFFFAIKKCTKGKMRHWNQAFRKEKPFGLNKKMQTLVGSGRFLLQEHDGLKEKSSETVFLTGSVHPLSRGARTGR